MGISTQKYDILTRLAIGNGSLVYKAVDKASLRQVALKLLTKDTDLDHKFDVDALFEAVPQIRQITGNHVCQLLDAFQDDDGPILVYEFAAGTNGAEFPHVKKLDAAQAVDVAAQLISALRSGERQRTPHGDIKPSNVLLVDTPEGRPFVFVLDCGLAAFRTEATTDSLPYLAPERLQGGPLSHQADLFAAGVLLFYLLTGKVLAMGETAEELASGWSRAKPEVLAELRPDLSPKFVQWVASLLALDPQKRPASAVDANAALGALNPPPPLAPAESIRPRPLSASQRAQANAPQSGIAAPPASKIQAPPISSVQRAVQSGVRPAQQSIPAPAASQAAPMVATIAQPVSSGVRAPATQATAKSPALNTPKKSPLGMLITLFAVVIALASTGVWWFTKPPKKDSSEPFVPSEPRHAIHDLREEARKADQSASPSSSGASIAVAQPSANPAPKPPAPTAAKPAPPPTPKPAPKPAPKSAPAAAKPASPNPAVVNSLAAKPPAAKPPAATLAEDSFTYATDAEFSAATTSGGWLGPWRNSGARVESESLAYDSHPLRGGRIVLPPGGQPTAVNRVLGPFTKLAAAGAKEAHWYFTTLVQHGDGTPAAGGELRIFPLDPSGSGTAVQFLLEDTGSGIRISIPGGGAPTIVSDNGQPIFLACRLDWTNPAAGKWDFTASLVINPSMKAKSFGEAGKPIVLATKGSVPPVQVGVLARKGAGIATTRLDEIRYEPHWVDVVFSSGK